MTTIYLPQVFTNNTVMGIQTTFPDYDIVEKLVNANIRATCIGGISWAKYEPQRGVFNDAEFDKARRSIKLLNDAKIQTIVVACDTPQWALDIGMSDLPENDVLKDKYIPDFVNFVEKIASLGQWANIQIYNEVDSKAGMKGIYGGWGMDAVYRYIDTLKALQPLRSKVAISTSIMANETYWSYVFAPFKDLVNYIYFHNYQYFGTGTPEKLARNAIERWQLFSEFIYKTNLYINETNLLSKIDTSDPLYETFENQKAEYFRYMHELAIENNVPLLMFFHWKTTWENAGIYGLPAWYELVELCA